MAEYYQREDVAKFIRSYRHSTDVAFHMEEHLEFYIIQEIKDDADYDSIDYLTSLIHIYEKCKAEEGETWSN